MISVAIASRNYGRYLPRALDSVFRCHNPTDAPIQVVVADDASTDNTRAVLAEYARRCPENLVVVSLRSTRGIGAAKNAALDRCEGRTVALLDADDEFLPEKLLHCHAALSRGDIDLVTNDFYQQPQEGSRILWDRRTWQDWRLPNGIWAFRNGLVRFNPHCLYVEDLEWQERRWRSLRHLHLDRPLNVLHVHGQNLHRTPACQAPGRQAMGRLIGQPSPDDRLAPLVWACRHCGSQFLVPTRCCGRGTVQRPLYFYLAALSPHCRDRTDFSLVMLTRNQLPLTRRAVGSLLDRFLAGQRHAVELIFVDGCSTDGTLDYYRSLAEAYPVKVIVTHPSEPFNYASACNRGAQVAGGKYLFLLNNDIELRSEDPVTPLRAALEDPRVGVVGATSIWSAAHRDPRWTAASPPYLLIDRPVTGDFWGMRREVFWELGGVDESFSGYGYDELDFQYRAQLAHYHLALARVQVHHDVHGTFDAVYGPEGRERMAQSNRRRFERKHRRVIHSVGTRMEPHSSHSLPDLSVVLVARDEAARVRETLARAYEDAGCREGRVQIVVVDNGSTDDTPLVMEEYRLRLPYCLTVVPLPEPILPARARRIGQARAVGRAVRVLQPGEWKESAAPAAR